ncbi:unnamed protein product [Amoebophrya sp. A120]|nr:unnamed protein product [Amoebophrya sp. A120]|eukprot:GSA120T00004769001.1
MNRSTTRPVSSSSREQEEESSRWWAFVKREFLSSSRSKEGWTFAEVIATVQLVVVVVIFALVYVLSLLPREAVARLQALRRRIARSDIFTMAERHQEEAQLLRAQGALLSRRKVRKFLLRREYNWCRCAMLAFFWLREEIRAVFACVTSMIVSRITYYTGSKMLLPTSSCRALDNKDDEDGTAKIRQILNAKEERRRRRAEALKRRVRVADARARTFPSEMSPWALVSEMKRGSQKLPLFGHGQERVDEGKHERSEQEPVKPVSNVPVLVSTLFREVSPVAEEAVELPVVIVPGEPVKTLDGSQSATLSQKGNSQKRRSSLRLMSCIF